MRGKRRQVGWYCNHHDEIGWENNTHIGTTYKRGKWVTVGATQHHVTHSALSYMHGEPPLCPRSVPVYVIDYPEPS